MVIDFTSETWRVIAIRAEERLAALRNKNDGDFSMEQTAKMRGRIFELKELLALANPAPANRADEP